MKIAFAKIDPSVTSHPGLHGQPGRISCGLTLELRLVPETMEDVDFIRSAPAYGPDPTWLQALVGKTPELADSSSPSIVVAVRPRVDGAASTALVIPAGTTATMLVHTDRGPLPLEVRANLG